MPEIFDITDWNQQPWFSTGGTRDKKYVQSPDNQYYYFKTSLLKPNKDYRFEFWSEIIAYEVGKQLNFNILRYDIAIDGSKIGCLSRSMINSEKEELNEGIKYLQAIDNTFDPENVKMRHRYSFQLIENSLAAFKLEKYIPEIIEVLVFDALIGNGDRHQENWAFISDFSILSKGISEMENDLENIELDKVPEFLKKIINHFYMTKGTKKIKPELKKAKLILNKNVRFAPIYDSGSSLGRELTDEKINRLLKNKIEFEAYVNRGLSEIHWNNKKFKHFELIKELKVKYPMDIKNSIEKVINNFNQTKINEIITNIDNQVPESFATYKLPENRKELIFKIITLRSQILGTFIK